jgi:hypothetical protein
VEGFLDVLRRSERSTWFHRAVANAGTTQTNILVPGMALHRDA